MEVTFSVMIPEIFLHKKSMRKKRVRKPITILDVAKAAGVSVSTVSRVLNDKDDVSLETYEKVQKVIEDLGFTSSLAARGMRSHRTRIIGLVMPDVSSLYCVEIMQGVNRVIMNSEYDLLVYTNGDINKYSTANHDSRFVMLLNGSIADGVIVVTPKATDFHTTAPLVIIDPNHEEPDYPAILSTNREGAQAAMAYLTGLGHRRIGHITGRLDLWSACQRLQGYKDGLAAAGIPVDDRLIQFGDYTTETALKCARTLLVMEDRPTAIFAANDMSAFGVYQAAEEAGLCVPQDVSIIGFDNLQAAAYQNPPLTTINQSISEMGAIATETILTLLKGETPEEKLKILPTQLIVRDSCQPPGAR